MDARRIWIATGTLGVLGVGLGATMAAADARADVDGPAVVTTDEGSTAQETPGSGAVPSPSDVDPTSSTTTVSTSSAGTADTARTAATAVSPLSPVSAQTSPSAPTP